MKIQKSNLQIKPPSTIITTSSHVKISWKWKWVLTEKWKRRREDWVRKNYPQKVNIFFHESEKIKSRCFYFFIFEEFIQHISHYFPTTTSSFVWCTLQKNVIVANIERKPKPRTNGKVKNVYVVNIHSYEENVFFIRT